MSNTSAPYGLLLRNTVEQAVGLPLIELPLASGTTGGAWNVIAANQFNIFQGDPIALLQAPAINVNTPTSIQLAYQNVPIDGIFNGCRYRNTNNQITLENYWTALTQTYSVIINGVNTPSFAHAQVLPISARMIWRIQSDLNPYAGNIINSMSYYMGNYFAMNAPLNSTTANTAQLQQLYQTSLRTGTSNISLDSSSKQGNTDGTHILRVIGVDSSKATPEISWADPYPDLLVQIMNPIFS